jgi:hypothetical protein
MQTMPEKAQVPFKEELPAETFMAVWFGRGK